MRQGPWGGAVKSIGLKDSRKRSEEVQHVTKPRRRNFQCRVAVLGHCMLNRLVLLKALSNHFPVCSPTSVVGRYPPKHYWNLHWSPIAVSNTVCSICSGERFQSLFGYISSCRMHISIRWSRGGVGPASLQGGGPGVFRLELPISAYLTRT